MKDWEDFKKVAKEVREKEVSDKYGVELESKIKQMLKINEKRPKESPQESPQN